MSDCVIYNIHVFQEVNFLHTGVKSSELHFYMKLGKSFHLLVFNLVFITFSPSQNITGEATCNQTIFFFQ